jgi:hypothetical protein
MNQDDAYILPIPANENFDVMARLDTGLDELYRLRRLMLARDTSKFSLDDWRGHKDALEHADKAISMYLAEL